MGSVSGRAALIVFNAARVFLPLVQAGDAPQSVLGDVVAAVEVPDPVGAVIRGGQPVGMLAAGPAGAVTRADRQRPELVERETPVKLLVQDLIDPVQLGVLVGICGFLP